MLAFVSYPIPFLIADEANFSGEVQSADHFWSRNHLLSNLGSFAGLAVQFHFRSTIFILHIKHIPHDSQLNFVLMTPVLFSLLFRPKKGTICIKLRAAQL